MPLVNRTKRYCYRKSRCSTSKNGGFLIQSHILFPGDHTYLANDLRNCMIIPVDVVGMGEGGVTFSFKNYNTCKNI